MNSGIESNSGLIHRIYTDGGAHTNGPLKGIGSWAFVEPDTCIDGVVEVFGEYIDSDTTNNRTEMLAVINAIESLPEHSCANIISDSGYFVKGYNHPSYLDSWIRNGWRTASNDAVMNMDLWQEIVRLSYHYGLTFTLVRGHYKDPDPNHAFWNGIVDKICTALMQDRKVGEFIYRYDIKSKTILGKRKWYESDISARG